jgi:hypothetical protein
MSAISLHCARCEYDLRTLNPAGLCPECALPIEQSLLASADPVGPDRPRIRLATTILLAAMSLRLAITLGILGYHRVEHSPIVFASILSQLLQLWPIDGASSSVVYFFRPNNYWILVRALLIAEFVLFCVGVAVITRRSAAATDKPAWAGSLRRISRWSAAASLVCFIAVRAIIESRFTGYLSFPGYNALVQCALIVPPVALVAWTARLLLLFTREQDPRVFFRWVVAYGIMITAVAAVFDAGWILEHGEVARYGAVLNVAAFVTASLMWWELRRRTRPRGGDVADTMP